MIWEKLAGPWKPERLDSLSSVVSLEGLNEQIDLILASKQMGRRVIDMWS